LQRVESRGAQLQHELRCVQGIGGIGCECDVHLLPGIDRRGVEREKVRGVQSQHGDADDVLPEEGAGKQIAAEFLMLPDRAGDHDCVEHRRLDDDGDRGRLQAVARRQEAQHQRKAHQEHDELQRREDALHQRPLGCVAPRALGQ